MARGRRLLASRGLLRRNSRLSTLDSRLEQARRPQIAVDAELIELLIARVDRMDRIDRAAGRARLVDPQAVYVVPHVRQRLIEDDDELVVPVVVLACVRELEVRSEERRVG